MNKVILMGRLTRDPDIRWTQGQDQKCIARWTLAVDRRMKRTENQNQQTADFISCVAWSKIAEFVEKYLVQGMKIVVVGRIQTGSYTNRDGNKVYTTDVVVEELDFAESKKNSDKSTQDARQRDIDAAKNGSYRDENGGYHDGYGSYDQSKEGFMNIPEGVEDEGLPFS